MSRAEDMLEGLTKLQEMQARIAHLEQQAARMANLPELPEGIVPPFLVHDGYEDRQWGKYVTDSKGATVVVDDYSAEFLANLLNACYPPAPGER